MFSRHTNTVHVPLSKGFGLFSSMKMKLLDHWSQTIKTNAHGLLLINRNC